MKVYVDIFGNPIVNEPTWREHLEEVCGETIDVLSENDIYAEVDIDEVD